MIKIIRPERGAKSRSGHCLAHVSSNLSRDLALVPLWRARDARTLQISHRSSATRVVPFDAYYDTSEVSLFALLLLTIGECCHVCAEAHGGGTRSFGLGRRSCEQAAGSGGCLPRGPSPRAAKRAADARGRGDCTPDGPCGGGPPATGGRPATAAVPDRRLHSARTDPLSRWRSLRRYPNLRASAGSRAGQSGADRESGDVAERDRAARQVHAALRRSLHCDVRGAERRSARGQDHRDAGSVLLAHRHRARRLSQWHSDGRPLHERAVPRRDALTHVGGRLVRRANPRADARCASRIDGSSIACSRTSSRTR